MTPSFLTRVHMRDGTQDRLESVFGLESSSSVARVLARLEHEKALAAKLMQSTSWSVCERAEAVEGILSEAWRVLNRAHNSPLALAATLNVLRDCFETSGRSTNARAAAHDARADDGSDSASSVGLGVGGSTGHSKGRASHESKVGMDAIKRAHKLEYRISTKLAARWAYRSSAA